jgi:hypothetical protein
VTVAVPLGFVTASGTTIQLFDFTGSTYAAMTDADFNNNTELYMTGSYEAA